MVITWKVFYLTKQINAAGRENLHFCPSPCFVPKVTTCDRPAIARWTTANKRDEFSLSLAVAAASPMLHTGTTPWKSQVLSRELGHHCPSWMAQLLPKEQNSGVINKHQGCRKIWELVFTRNVLNYTDTLGHTYSTKVGPFLSTNNWSNTVPGMQ